MNKDIEKFEYLIPLNDILCEIGSKLGFANYTHGPVDLSNPDNSTKAGNLKVCQIAIEILDYYSNILKNKKAEMQKNE